MSEEVVRPVEARRERAARLTRAVALVLEIVLLAGMTAAGTPHARAEESVVATGYVPLSDGTLLHYLYELPHGRPDAEFPTAVIYHGYSNGLGYGWDWELVKAGYAVVQVTVRGAGCSSGTWELFSPAQIDDGIEVLRWVAAQDWSDDDAIALAGESYAAIMGFLVAGEVGERRAAGETLPLAALLAPHPLGDLYRDVAYPGGVPNSAITLAITAQQNAASGQGAMRTAFTDLVGGDLRCAAHLAARGSAARYQAPIEAARRPWDDSEYHARSAIYRARFIDVPVFTVVAWQDETTGSRPLELLEELRVPYRAVVGNGHHQLSYTAFGEGIAFLDLHLRGEGKPPSSPITVLWESRRVPGQLPVAPSWTSELGAWPPAQAQLARFHLAAGGRLTSEPAQGAPDAYVAVTPGQSQLGDARFGGTFGISAWKAEPAPGAALAYTSGPFGRDVTVIGSASLDLWLASTAPDTDIQATITEVRPNGEEVYVQQGWLRASHRALDLERSRPERPYHPHTRGSAELLTLGVPELLRVEIRPFGHVFRAGSRLRVWIEAPKVVPDLAGFVPYVPAVNRVYHDVGHPSQLVVSVLPGQKAHATPPTCQQPAIHQPCR